MRQVKTILPAGAAGEVGEGRSSISIGAGEGEGWTRAMAVSVMESQLAGVGAAVGMAAPTNEQPPMINAANKNIKNLPGFIPAP